MKSSSFDSGTAMKSALAPLDRRYAERVPLHCRVSFTTEDGPSHVRGEGTLKDLSKTGCKITADSLPPVGCSVTLFIYIDDGNPPMCLTGATVSWVAGQLFAAKFPKLSSEERKRLQEMVWKNARLIPTKHERTAFRI